MHTRVHNSRGIWLFRRLTTALQEDSTWRLLSLPFPVVSNHIITSDSCGKQNNTHSLTIGIFIRAWYIFISISNCGCHCQLTINRVKPADMCRSDLEPGLLSKIHVKIHVRWQEFSNMASNWLAALQPANQMPGLKIFVNVYCNMEIS